MSNCPTYTIENHIYATSIKKEEVRFLGTKPNPSGLKKIKDVSCCKTNNGKKEEWKLIVEEGAYLGEILDRIPYGILDKGATGIGATTLELTSPRNSIIVVPTKSLAYTKNSKHQDSFYVGSDIKTKRSPTGAEIKRYSERTDIHKKFIVVADSLGKAIKAIGDDVYKNYFLMIDEVDVIQSDSTFRPRLEDVIDYYLLFPKECRALVTATFREFSHPELMNEVKTTIEYNDVTPRTIHLYYTNYSHDVAKERIESIRTSYPNEKILVAYNYVVGINSIINILDEKYKGECGILCGESNKANAGKLYRELDKTGKLDDTITFMTSAYFAGIDIQEKLHIIAISDINVIASLLSINKMTQIIGRCREGGCVLSEEVIYTTKENDSTKKQHSISFKDGLHELAQIIVQLYDKADEFKKKLPTSEWIVDKIKNTIENVAGQGDNNTIQLVRADINGHNKIAYFTIDALAEKNELRTDIYSSKNELKKRLETKNNVEWHDYMRPKKTKEEKKKHKDNNKKGIKEKNKGKKDSLEKLFDRIKEINEGLASIGQKELRGSDWSDLRTEFRSIAPTVYFIEKLSNYYSIATLAKHMQLFEGKKDINRKVFNQLMYKALPKTHQFKAAIEKAFIYNKSMEKKEVCEKLSGIMKTHLNREIKQIKDVYSYLRMFYDFTSREGTNGTVIIKKHYPKRVELIEPVKPEIMSDKVDVKDIFDFG